MEMEMKINSHTKTEGQIEFISESRYYKHHNGHDVLVCLPVYTIKSIGYNIDGHCQHEFVFGKETKFATCLRSHDISRCCRCKKAKHSDVSLNAVSAYIKGTLVQSNDLEHCPDYFRTPYPHYHVWREDGTCGSKFVFPTDTNGNQLGQDELYEGVFVGNCIRDCPASRMI